VNAVRFNLQLGYQLCDSQENIDHQRYEMTKESFEQKAGRIRKAVQSLGGNDNKSKILFEPTDYETGVAQKFEELLNAYSPQLEREETREGIWYREI
jgi:hypothetical protein